MSLWISRVTDVAVLILYGLFIKEIFTLWASPSLDDASRVLTVTLVTLFEMILIHVSIMMPKLNDWKSRLIAIGALSCFALGFSFALPNQTIIFIYMGVVISRLVFVLSNPTRLQIKASENRSALSVAIYLLGIFATIIFGGVIPKLGLTNEWIVATDYVATSGSGGLYIEEPHLALSFATFYFTVMLVFDGWRMFKSSQNNKYQNI